MEQSLSDFSRVVAEPPGPKDSHFKSKVQTAGPERPAVFVVVMLKSGLLLRRRGADAIVHADERSNNVSSSQRKSFRLPRCCCWSWRPRLRPAPAFPNRWDCGGHRRISRPASFTSRGELGAATSTLRNRRRASARLPSISNSWEIDIRADFQWSGRAYETVSQALQWSTQ